LQWKWSSFAAKLDHFEFDTFRIDAEIIGSPKARFAVDRSGQVAAMILSIDPEVTFQKTSFSKPVERDRGR
jgi:hypothetical protein